MSITEQITPMLASLYEPLTGLTLKQMHLKPAVERHNDGLTLKLTSGFPCTPLKHSLKPLIENTLSMALPSEKITVECETHIRPHRTQMPGKGLRGVKNTIAVASGKGGVGKSTVTVNLAVALARAGARVGILDADIYGPSIPMMLGEHSQVEIEQEQYLPVRAHGIQAMSIGYLTDPDNALIWRGPMLAKSLLQMLDITRWDELDYLFIDLPPGTGDIQLSLVQKIPLTGAIVVTTPQNIATLDAQKAIKMFAKTNINVLGLIENMALHICSACGHQEAIFGQGGALALCERHQLPLLGQMPLDARIRDNSDKGQPIAAEQASGLADLWLKAALQTAISLAGTPINYSDGMPPVVTE